MSAAIPAGQLGRVTVTPDQHAFAESLIRGFHRMTPTQVTELQESLKKEDLPLFETIHAARELIEQGQVVEVPRQGNPIAIDALSTKLGWAVDSWQRKLLDALDGAGNFERDGRVLASEIVTGLRNPDSPRFLTTATIERLQSLIGQQGETGAVITDLKAAWVKELASAADRAGDRNERIDKAEIEKYLATNPEAYDKLAIQNVAVMLHQIAEATGEPDPFKLVAKGTDLSVVRTSYVGSFDGPKVISRVIAQAITASDLVRRGSIERPDNFHADQLLPEFLAAGPKDYRKTGYDMGHLAAAADGTTLANVEASFSLMNMAPQLPGLNRFSWRYLEASVRDLIVATGARAMVYTGNLFLDAEGKPIPDDKLKRIGVGHKIAVPTHCFKTVLLHLPGGKMTTLSYILPNTEPLPRGEKECMKLVQSSRASIAQIEALAGVKLFDGLLPPDLEKEIKNDKTATVAVKEAASLKATQFLWAPGGETRSWNSSMSYDVDAQLELVAGRMKQIAGDGILDRNLLQPTHDLFDKVKGNGVISKTEAQQLVLSVPVISLSVTEAQEALLIIKAAVDLARAQNARNPLLALQRRLESRAAGGI